MNPEVTEQIKWWVDFVSSPLPLYIVALLGMFSHFLKKNMRGETNTNVLSYFKDNIASTLNAFIWVTFSYFVYLQNVYNGGGVLDIAAVFMIGFTFDSLMNKYSPKTIGTDEPTNKLVG